MDKPQDQLEIRFRLTDGSDIGPKSFSTATSVASLKENVISQWPKDKENGPRTLKDVKIISGGKILVDNNRTLGECRSPMCDIPGGGVTTMHVLVQTPSAEKGSEKNASKEEKQVKFIRTIKEADLPSVAKQTKQLLIASVGADR